jgi:hypothetical protein
MPDPHNGPTNTVGIFMENVSRHVEIFHTCV